MSLRQGTPSQLEELLQMDEICLAIMLAEKARELPLDGFPPTQIGTMLQDRRAPLLEAFLNVNCNHARNNCPDFWTLSGHDTVRLGHQVCFALFFKKVKLA
jgi:hypothetical protein